MASSPFPRPLHQLFVGITGHRPPLLDDEAEAMARPWLIEILADLAEAAADLVASQPEQSGEAPRPPVFVSPLAEGADQLGATVALGLGYSLKTILPLPPDDYRSDFDPAGLAGFNALIGRADSIMVLPQQDGGRPESYALAGRVTIEQSDIMIALWDGEPARGVGGTAEVVSLAVRSGTPVVHLTIPSEEPGRILWTGYGELTDPEDMNSLPYRPIDRGSLRELIFILFGGDQAAKYRR